MKKAMTVLALIISMNLLSGRIEVEISDIKVLVVKNNILTNATK